MGSLAVIDAFLFGRVTDGEAKASGEEIRHLMMMRDPVTGQVEGWRRMGHLNECFTIVSDKLDSEAEGEFKDGHFKVKRRVQLLAAKDGKDGESVSERGFLSSLGVT